LLLILVVSILPVTVAAEPKLPKEHAISPLSLKDKVTPKLLKEIEAATAQSESRVIVLLRDQAQKSPTLQLMADLSARVTAQFKLINAVAATLPTSKLPAVAFFDDVQMVFQDTKKQVIPPKTDMPKPSRKVTKAEAVQASTPAWYSQFPFWIGADKVWAKGFTGEGVRVGMLDTGIFYEHPDLAGVVEDYKVFTSERDVFPHDNNGHGTATASCIAAQGIVDWDLGVQGLVFRVKGVAPGAKIIGAKIFTEGGWGWDSWILSGLEWLVEKNVNIISYSGGGLDIPNAGLDPVALAFDKASERGITCFCAAGNSQGRSTVSSTADASKVISVGASTENNFTYTWLGYWPFTWNGYSADGYENDQIIFWSSEGPTADGRIDPDICAIGAWDMTLDTYPYYLWLQFGGTSMSTPIAAGVGALVMQAYRDAHGSSPSPETVRAILSGTAQNLGYPANKQGGGRVDAYEAYFAAIDKRVYPDVSYLSTDPLMPGDTLKTTIDFTESIDAVSTYTFETVGTPLVLSGSGTVDQTIFLEDFTVPGGVDFLEATLKYDPEVNFGDPVQAYDGSQWTDAHINTALYAVEPNGENIMVNYAYSHTNQQWMQARVSPGDYRIRGDVLGYGLAPGTSIEFDVQITMMHRVEWPMVSAVRVGNTGAEVTFKVPLTAYPGTYSGFIQATAGEDEVLIPVNVNVAAQLEHTFTLPFHVAFEPREYISGDWHYVPLYVPPGEKSITLIADWTEEVADFDFFAVTPTGRRVEAGSFAPSASVLLPSGGGKRWWTNTGGTAELLTLKHPKSGYWLIGIHNAFFGNNFVEEVTITATTDIAITAPKLLSIKAGSTQKVDVSNHAGFGLSVQTEVLRYWVLPFADSIKDKVTSRRNKGEGWDGWLIPVGPEIERLQVALQWPGHAKLGISLYDPAGHLIGIVRSKGEAITVNSPTIGPWTIIITTEDLSAPYTVIVSGLFHPQFTGITLSPASFTAHPGPNSLSVSADPSASGMGYIVYYSFDTGNIYATTGILIRR